VLKTAPFSALSVGYKRGRPNPLLLEASVMKGLIHEGL
jgi:hypothetical protein